MEQGHAGPEMAAGLTPLTRNIRQGETTYDSCNAFSKRFFGQLRKIGFVIGRIRKPIGIYLLVDQPKFNQEIFDEIWDKIGYVLGLIVVSTFFILMIAFRSLLIPIKAILMNIIGLSATFGILVYIFQYGHFGITAGQSRLSFQSSSLVLFLG